MTTLGIDASQLVEELRVAQFHRLQERQPVGEGEFLYVALQKLVAAAAGLVGSRHYGGYLVAVGYQRFQRGYRELGCPEKYYLHL